MFLILNDLARVVIRHLPAIFADVNRLRANHL